MKSPGRTEVMGRGGREGLLTDAELVGIDKAFGFFFRDRSQLFIFNKYLEIARICVNTLSAKCSSPFGNNKIGSQGIQLVSAILLE
jgi:hypothetical protein